MEDLTNQEQDKTATSSKPELVSNKSFFSKLKEADLKHQNKRGTIIVEFFRTNSVKKPKRPETFQRREP